MHKIAFKNPVLESWEFVKTFVNHGENLQEVILLNSTVRREQDKI